MSQWQKWFACLLFVAVVSLVLLHLRVTAGQTESDAENLKQAAERIAETARTKFAPVYPALAKQIIEDTGVKEGICIDLGTGAGALGIALAKAGNFKVYAVDINPFAVAIAQKNAVEAEVSDRFFPMLGNALDLPFKDNFADLVVSRGMIPFIEDKAAVFREAYRVLKKGGAAYIGGGFSRMLDEETVVKIVKEAWGDPQKLPIRRMPKEFWEEQVKKAGITNYRIIEDRYPSGVYGTWVMFKKQ